MFWCLKAKMTAVEATRSLDLPAFNEILVRTRSPHLQFKCDQWLCLWRQTHHFMCDLLPDFSAFLFKYHTELNILVSYPKIWSLKHSFKKLTCVWSETSRSTARQKEKCHQEVWNLWGFKFGVKQTGHFIWAKGTTPGGTWSWTSCSPRESRWADFNLSHTVCL